MTTTRRVTRTHGQFLANGTTPTNQPFANTMTIALGGVSSYSTLRLRTDIEMYVLAGGGTTDVNLAFAFESVFALGGIMYEGGSQTSSSTPLTDENISPGILGQLGDWGQWEYLYPDIQFVNVNVPQTVLVTWRPRGGTIDTQFRRRSDTINGIDLWMPWEIQDGAGLINTTDAGGNTYNLGVRFAQALFWEDRT